MLTLLIERASFRELSASQRWIVDQLQDRKHAYVALQEKEKTSAAVIGTVLALHQGRARPMTDTQVIYFSNDAVRVARMFQQLNLYDSFSVAVARQNVSANVIVGLPSQIVQMIGNNILRLDSLEYMIVDDFDELESVQDEYEAIGCFHLDPKRHVTVMFLNRQANMDRLQELSDLLGPVMFYHRKTDTAKAAETKETRVEHDQCQYLNCIEYSTHPIELNPDEEVVYVGSRYNVLVNNLVDEQLDAEMPEIDVVLHIDVPVSRNAFRNRFIMFPSARHIFLDKEGTKLHQLHSMCLKTVIQLVDTGE